MKTEPGNYQYLVMVCHSMDDVPVLLTKCEESAFDFAQSVAWDVMGMPLAGVMNLPDMQTPVCTAVVTFRDGVPCSRIIVRNFDDDDDGDQAVIDPNPELSTN